MLPQISLLASSQIPLPIAVVSATPTAIGVSVPLVQQVSSIKESNKNNTNENTSNKEQTGKQLAAAFGEVYKGEIKYSVDKETGIITFTVIDPTTKKVIRQVPSEEIVAMARRLKQQGLLLDKEG